MGGEKFVVCFVPGINKGSPPRGRGKVCALFCGAGGIGITPAWAGKRSVAFHKHWSLGDHPRVGGEKLFGQLDRAGVPGSPPRGRGKAPEMVQGTAKARITPAWAGKRRLFIKMLISDGDHPRVGGEKTKKIP